MLTLCDSRCDGEQDGKYSFGFRLPYLETNSSAFCLFALPSVEIEILSFSSIIFSLSSSFCNVFDRATQ